MPQQETQILRNSNLSRLRRSRIPLLVVSPGTTATVGATRWHDCFGKWEGGDETSVMGFSDDWVLGGLGGIEGVFEGRI